MPAGQALAVDRDEFAKKVTEEIEKNKNIELIRKEITKIPENKNVIIATGPLTSDGLINEILKLTGGENLSFFDAAAPIIEKDSINMDIAFYGDRYEQERDKEEEFDEWQERVKNQNPSYINLPMNKEEYEKFWTELVNAEIVVLHEFEKKEIFEGCMPVETL